MNIRVLGEAVSIIADDPSSFPSLDYKQRMPGGSGVDILARLAAVLRSPPSTLHLQGSFHNMLCSLNHGFCMLGAPICHRLLLLTCHSGLVSLAAPVR